MNKIILMVTLGTILTTQAQAFEITGEASQSQFVMEESCDSLSRQFISQVREEAESNADEVAVTKCSNQTPERTSDFTVSLSCSTYAAWNSMTKLSVKVIAEYECLVIN